MAIPAPLREPGETELLSLVARMASGDQAALASLYDHLSPLVHGICLRVLREPAAAEEATLEAFLQAWNAAGTYDRARGSVAAWLLMIARSRALDAARSRVRAERRDQIAAELPEPEPSPDLLAHEAARSKAVREALSRLHADQRSLLVMSFYQGLSHQEIAAKVGAPLGTVKTRIRTGLQRLRAELGSSPESFS